MAITLIIGQCTAIAEVVDDYAVQVVKFFIDGHVFGEAFLEPYISQNALILYY